MITDRFAVCLETLLSVEGGYVNNAADSGGPTNLGISQGALSAWLGHQAAIAEVKALTPTTVAPIYRANYWLATACDSLPLGLDRMTFDCAVNMGVGVSARLLQTAAGVKADGHVGPLTIDAVRHHDVVGMIKSFAVARETRYRGLSNFNVFGAGWLNRLATVTGEALKDADA